MREYRVQLYNPTTNERTILIVNIFSDDLAISEVMAQQVWSAYGGYKFEKIISWSEEKEGMHYFDEKWDESVDMFAPLRQKKLGQVKRILIMASS